MYINQHWNVSWNNSVTGYLSTTNVVKQGGVLFPISFLSI